MQTKEEKICSFTQKGTRLQLVKIMTGYKQIIHDQDFKPIKTDEVWWKPKYQVRLNRKIVSSSISEYNERKMFATYAQNIVLQLKIY